MFVLIKFINTAKFIFFLILDLMFQNFMMIILISKLYKMYATIMQLYD